MNIQVETITTASGKMDVIRDVEMVRWIIARAAQAEKELDDNERWMREVLTDFRIQFDDHKIGRRLAFTQWMADHQSANQTP